MMALGPSRRAIMAKRTCMHLTIRHDTVGCACLSRTVALCRGVSRAPLARVVDTLRRAAPSHPVPSFATVRLPFGSRAGPRASPAPARRQRRPLGPRRPPVRGGQPPTPLPQIGRAHV